MLDTTSAIVGVTGKKTEIPVMLSGFQPVIWNYDVLEDDVERFPLSFKK